MALQEDLRTGRLLMEPRMISMVILRIGHRLMFRRTLKPQIIRRIASRVAQLADQRMLGPRDRQLDFLSIHLLKILHPAIP
ncbi:MAG: hypothetical protein DCF25_07480 [Leptolyngbya foveolarum]|uniref:Uncharacterized protein n=1 Tax=Leptolyngbya foveolarum TaxID=47253 RepID=A0A2W4UL02_9CYAN|nr:MAG: hypothetical protein DCF25_07480 [Leptolyngbya foveolarum]